MATSRQIQIPLRILVVDGDAVVLAFIRAALRGDAEVDECSSVDAALGALRAGNYDALVLELLLPGTYGLEILRALASA